MTAGARTMAKRRLTASHVFTRHALLTWSLPLSALGLSLMAPPAEARSQDDAPVCITAVGDKLVAIPGDCPDPMAPAKRRSTDNGMGGAGSPSGSSKKASRSQPAEYSGSVENIEPVYSSGGYAAPARSAVDGVEKTLARLASLPDESQALNEFEGFVSQGSSVVPATATVFLDRKVDSRVRWVAGRALGRIYSPRSVDTLILGLREPVPLLRIAAVKGLAELGDRKALPGLRSALGDDAAVVRAAAIDALGSLGTRNEVPLIIAQLNATKNFSRGRGIFVRPHAAQALGSLGGPEATQALIEVVNDADPETRSAAHAALLNLSGRSVAPAGPGSEQERWQSWWNEQRH